MTLSFKKYIQVSGLFYVIGGLLYGLFIYRKAILSPKASLLLSCASLATILAGFVPHPLDRLLALPMSIALMWIGYCLVKRASLIQTQQDHDQPLSNESIV